ncbi:MAG: family 43 glycosylhydrolase [Lachnospiraceae bacterium]|nr:family 43 glycosylhydrolase [Lachnospiraceae bacterium]
MSELYDAIITQNMPEVKRLLKIDPKAINEEVDGAPLSFLAARMGNYELIRHVVEYSMASFNNFDSQHRHILHYGAESGSVEVCRYLVERVGMDPTTGDQDLITPYEIAAQHGHQDLMAYFAKVCGAKLQNMYKNPILTGMHPDPSICRVGEDYYMVNSSFIFFPCIPVLHSRDLIHWETIGHAITNPEWAMLDTLEGGRGYWAADISYYQGRFYICATYRLNDDGTVFRKQIVVSSDQPQGPYSKPAIIEEDGIDPSIFNDDDGRRYMLLNRGARIFKLNADATEKIGEASLLFYGDHKRAPEGPHLLKKDGWYYLFEAEGGTGAGHRITVSRAKSLFGVYEPCPYNPIMRQEDPTAPIQRCGHGKPVMTQNGEWYMVYLCGRQIDGKYSMLGRETALDPITWTEDGWPIVNHRKGPSYLQKKPDLAECMLQDDCTLDLTRDALSPIWVTPRAPEKDAIVVKDGILYLKGSTAPLSDVASRNILLRRQTDFCFTAQAQFALQELKEEQSEGMIGYYDENTWISFGLHRDENGYSIYVMEHIGHENIMHEPVYLSLENQTGNTYKSNTYKSNTYKSITYKMETDYLKRRFSFRMEGEAWQEYLTLGNVYYLCDEGIQMGKRFTGAMVGMYAYAGKEPYTAKIQGFSYEAVKG